MFPFRSLIYWSAGSQLHLDIRFAFSLLQIINARFLAFTLTNYPNPLLPVIHGTIHNKSKSHCFSVCCRLKSCPGSTNLPWDVRILSHIRTGTSPGYPSRSKSDVSERCHEHSIWKFTWAMSAKRRKRWPHQLTMCNVVREALLNQINPLSTLNNAWTFPIIFNKPLNSLFHNNGEKYD